MVFFDNFDTASLSSTMHRSQLLLLISLFICFLSFCHFDGTSCCWHVFSGKWFDWTQARLGHTAAPPARFTLARQLVKEGNWEWENRGNFSRFPQWRRGCEETQPREVTTVLLMKELQLLHQPIILVFLYYLEQFWGDWKVKALMWKRWKYIVWCGLAW